METRTEHQDKAPLERLPKNVGVGGNPLTVAQEELSSLNSRQTQHELGQFLTPAHVAELMASFLQSVPDVIELLDAGAGKGALTAALIARLLEGTSKPKQVAVTAYEIDSSLIAPLRERLNFCQQGCEGLGVEFQSRIINDDFIGAVVPLLRSDLFSLGDPVFNLAIVNPPYRKLPSDSSTNHLLRSIGIETSNFYAAFITLISRLLKPGSELVAITPRSFCNGPYFKAFRLELLRSMSLRRLHLFDSRSAAFGKDSVLQENIILHAVKSEPQVPRVILSRSNGREGGRVTERCVPFDEVVLPYDSERFIHIGANESNNDTRTSIESFVDSLTDLELSVSTGRVVDFRARDFLRKLPGVDTAPLIYPTHFNGRYVGWPKQESRKHDAIMISSKTRGLLVPKGFYVLVKRFSSKEEKKRIVACVYDPNLIDAAWVGFENHLNYFHSNGQGLSETLALGLAAFLNSAPVDQYFRQFSGHTQVNATDLRRFKYPSLLALNSLGKRLVSSKNSSDLETLVRDLFDANK